MFVGLNGIAVKSHGGADALSYANAIGVAHDMAVGGFNQRIKDEFERLTAASQEAALVAEPLAPPKGSAAL